MKSYCRKSCPDVCNDGSLDLGESQTATDEKTRVLIASSLKYLQTEVNVDKKYKPSVRAKCKNQHEFCSFWATRGECEQNPTYMRGNCALACQSCYWFDVSLRCPWDPNNITAALGPGDLNKMFERITTDPEFKQYNPTILLQPPDGPWVVTLDDFVSEQECDALIEAGGKLGYQRSKHAERGVNGESISQVSELRTSYHAWCLDECYTSEAAKNVSARIERVTGIGETYSGYFQLLKYEKDQYYKVHHDFIPTHVERPMGPRLLTVYIYLNEPEEGGGTRFPYLGDGGLTVQPKRGRALIWPSVLNDKPMSEDSRTQHEALPVIAGHKFGANAWIHMGDYKAAFARRCH